MFSGHVYGNAVFTAVVELETEVADLDDVPELELVPVVGEVPAELELVPTVDEVPEELELVPAIDEVPEELELVPAIDEVPEELELVPTVDEVPEELAEFVRLEEVVLLVTELELEFELEFVGGPAEKTTAPAG